MREKETRPAGTVEPSTWIGVALAILAIVFVVQNQAEAPIQLFWWEVSAPLWLVLLVIFLVGWAAGALVRYRRRRR